MQHELHADIAILGGGCAGLWLVHDFAKRGYKSVLLEHGPLAQYASQGNQGWLHSGALYAVFESEEPLTSAGTPELRSMARECRKGYVRLRRFARRHCKNAVDPRSGCMFLYDDGDKADRARRLLKSYGLEPRVYTSNLELLEPVLAGSQAHTALLTRDLPFDAGRMLNAIMRRAVAMGAHFIDSGEPLELFQIIRDGQRWVVKNKSLTISVSAVVCATGALVFKQQPGLNFLTTTAGIQKCEVAVFDSRICTRLLSFRIKEARDLSIVPFRGGTTLNLNASDTDTADVSDRNIGETCFDDLADVISIYLPGIERWRVPIRSHAYVCQKVGNESRTSRPIHKYGKRHFFWVEAEGSPGVYYMYPGKFTLSANCSSAMANHILASGVLNRTTAKSSAQMPKPPVGPSPYHVEPTHLLVKDEHGELRFVQRTV